MGPCHLLPSSPKVIITDTSAMATLLIKLVSAFLVGIALTTRVFGFEDNDINGIAYIHQTVDDLTKAVRFYTEVLDGMLIQEFRMRNGQDDFLQNQFFQKEILDARSRGVSAESIGVPNIAARGTHVVNWDFVLFDNALLWLIQFTDRNGNPFRSFDTAAGSAKYGYAHMALWIDSNVVNPYQMIQEMYDGQRNISSNYVGFTANEEVSSSAQRNDLFQTNIDKFFTPENEGFSFGNTRGTAGEKVEVVIRRGKGSDANVKTFCQTGAVHSVMFNPAINPAAKNKFKKPSNVRTIGFHHISITVPNTQEALEFYTTLVGGKNGQTSPGLQFPPFFSQMIVQDDIIAAQELNRNLDANFGYVDITLGNPNAGSLDISFINFDNFFLELYTYNPVDTNDRRALQRSFSSPAYRNVMSPGFYLKDNVNMSTYIRNLESGAAARGWTSVKANRAVDVNQLGANVADQDYSRPFASGGLSGFEFTFVKGPGGEQFSVAKFTGQARDVLQRSMKMYGAVSTAFPETNPYTWGGFDEVCSRLNQESTTTTEQPPTKASMGRWGGRWGAGGRWGHQH